MTKLSAELLNQLRENDPSLGSELSLYFHSIGDEGARVLADALRRNKTITTLDLWENDIGDEGAKALADALCQNETVTRLHLVRNRIGDEGAKALACVFLLNATICSLNLYRNDIGEEGKKAFADAIHLLKSDVVSEEEAMGLVRELSPDLQLSLGTIARLGKQAAAQQSKRDGHSNARLPTASFGLFINDLRYSEGINQPGRTEILRIMHKAGIEQVEQKARLVKEEFIPPMLERIGFHLGLVGIFEVVRARPHLLLILGAPSFLQLPPLVLAHAPMMGRSSHRGTRPPSGEVRHGSNDASRRARDGTGADDARGARR